MELASWIEISFVYLCLVFCLRLFSSAFQQAMAPAFKCILKSGLGGRISSLFSGVWLGFTTQSAHQIQVLCLTAYNAGSFQLLQSSHLILGAHVGAAFFAITFLLPLYSWVLPVGVMGLLMASTWSKGYLREIGFAIAGGSVFYFVKNYATQYIELTAPDTTLFMGVIFALSLISRSSLVALLAAILWNPPLTYNYAFAVVIAANFGTLFGMVPALVKGRPALFELLAIQFIQKSIGTLAVFFVMTQQYLPLSKVLAFEFGEWIVVLHILFNLIGTLVTFLVYPWVNQLLVEMAPQKKIAQKLLYFGLATEIPPEGAVYLVSQEVQRLMALVVRQYEILLQPHSSAESAQQIDKYEVISDHVKKEVRAFIVMAQQSRLLFEQSRELQLSLTLIEELERISDQIQKLSQLIRQQNDRHILVRLEEAQLITQFQNFERIFSSLTTDQRGECAQVLKEIERSMALVQTDEVTPEMQLGFHAKKLFAHLQNICQRLGDQV